MSDLKNINRETAIILRKKAYAMVEAFEEEYLTNEGNIIPHLTVLSAWRELAEAVFLFNHVNGNENSHKIKDDAEAKE